MGHKQHRRPPALLLSISPGSLGAVVPSVPGWIAPNSVRHRTSFRRSSDQGTGSLVPLPSQALEAEAAREEVTSLLLLQNFANSFLKGWSLHLWSKGISSEPRIDFSREEIVQFRQARILGRNIWKLQKDQILRG